MKSIIVLVLCLFTVNLFGYETWGYMTKWNKTIYTNLTRTKDYHLKNGYTLLAMSKSAVGEKVSKSLDKVAAEYYQSQAQGFMDLKPAQFAGRFSEDAEQAMAETDKKHAKEIKALTTLTPEETADIFKGMNRRTDKLNQAIRELRFAGEKNIRSARRWNRAIGLFGGAVQLSIGYWGFRQENSYGNVTGVMFSISGLYHIYTVVK